MPMHFDSAQKVVDEFYRGNLSWSWLQPPAGQVEQTLTKAVHRKLAPAAAEWARTLDERGLAVKSPLDGTGLVPEDFGLGYMSAFNRRLAQTLEGTTPMLKTYDQYARSGGPAEGVAMAFNESYNPLYRIPVGWMTAVDDWNKEDYRGSGRATGTTAFETGMLAVAVGGAVAGAAPAIRAGVGDFIEGELVSRGLSGGGATYEGSAEVQWGARLEEGLPAMDNGAPTRGGAPWRTLGARPDPKVVAQDGDMWCGQACVETLGKRLGFKITQGEATLKLTSDEAVAKFGRGVGEGTTPDQLQYVLRSADPSPGEWEQIYPDADPNIRTNQLNDTLATGPSLALLDDPDPPVGASEEVTAHWVIVEPTLDPEYVQISDPEPYLNGMPEGKTYRISVSEFLEHWVATVAKE